MITNIDVEDFQIGICFVFPNITWKWYRIELVNVEVNIWENTSQSNNIQTIILSRKKFLDWEMYHKSKQLTRCQYFFVKLSLSTIQIFFML